MCEIYESVFNIGDISMNGLVCCITDYWLLAVAIIHRIFHSSRPSRCCPLMISMLWWACNTVSERSLNILYSVHRRRDPLACFVETFQLSFSSLISNDPREGPHENELIAWAPSLPAVSFLGPDGRKTRSPAAPKPDKASS